MKRIIYFLVIASVLTIAVTIFIKPVIIFLAKSQLKRVFIASTVFIKDCDFKPLRQLSLSDVEIKRNEIYDFKVKKVNIQYSLLSIFKRNILKFSLKDTVIDINLPKEGILKINQYLNLSSPRLFSVKTLELFNLNLNLNATDLNLVARASTELSLAKQLIDSLDFKIDSLVSQKFRLENAFLKINQKQVLGDFGIQKLQYDKFKTENIKSRVRIENKNLFLDSLSAKLLDGGVQGDLSLKIEKNPEYLVNLKFINLDLETVVKDFNLEEKLKMSGRIGGIAALKGRGSDINILSGDFNAIEPGGILTIKDTGFLEKIARNSNQSLDIMMESFKNYCYNKGVMKLSLDKSNLILDIALEGQAGKRNLNIILHDFRLRRGGL